MSPAQGKGVQDYEGLVSEVFQEASRALKPQGAATVVFHASKPEVWRALGSAFDSANLEVACSSILDKRQVSFKQVVASASTRGDAVFLLRPGKSAAERSAPATAPPPRAGQANRSNDQSPQHMYSQYAAECVQGRRSVRWSASEFYNLVASGDPVCGGV